MFDDFQYSMTYPTNLWRRLEGETFEDASLCLAQQIDFSDISPNQEPWPFNKGKYGNENMKYKIAEHLHLLAEHFSCTCFAFCEDSILVVGFLLQNRTIMTHRLLLYQIAYSGLDYIDRKFEEHFTHADERWERRYIRDTNIKPDWFSISGPPIRASYHIEEVLVKP
jgi:hypothetical protein